MSVFRNAFLNFMDLQRYIQWFIVESACANDIFYTINPTLLSNKAERKHKQKSCLLKYQGQEYPT